MRDHVSESCPLHSSCEPACHASPHLGSLIPGTCAHEALRDVHGHGATQVAGPGPRELGKGLQRATVLKGPFGPCAHAPGRCRGPRRSRNGMGRLSDDPAAPQPRPEALVAEHAPGDALGGQLRVVCAEVMDLGVRCATFM